MRRNARTGCPNSALILRSTGSRFTSAGSCRWPLRLSVSLPQRHEGRTFKSRAALFHSRVASLKKKRWARRFKERSPRRKVFPIQYRSEFSFSNGMAIFHRAPVSPAAARERRSRELLIASRASMIRLASATCHPAIQRRRVRKLTRAASEDERKAEPPAKSSSSRMRGAASGLVRSRRDHDVGQ